MGVEVLKQTEQGRPQKLQKSCSFVHHDTKMVPLPALGVLSCLSIVHAYIWPSPQLDALEAVRFDQLGFTVLGSSLANFVSPCNLFLFGTTAGGETSGRSDAADWIRTVGFILALVSVIYCNCFPLGIPRCSDPQFYRWYGRFGRLHTISGRASTA